LTPRGLGFLISRCLRTPARRSRDAASTARSRSSRAASKGIGLAIASRLAREGARIAINARPRPDLERALRQLETEGADAFAVPGDITQPGVVERVVEAAHARFGRVTHVVQNAAVSPHFGPLLAISQRDLGDTLLGNTWPVLALLQSALAAGMQEARGAAVVISSIGSRLTSPTIAAYDAAKAALNSLTRALARELGTRGVRLNLVSPGLIATPRRAGGSHRGPRRARRAVGDVSGRPVGDRCDRQPTRCGRSPRIRSSSSWARSSTAMTRRGATPVIWRVSLRPESSRRRIRGDPGSRRRLRRAHGPDGPRPHLDDICRILASGKNVVTTVLTDLIYPSVMGPEVVDRLEAACRAGGVSFHGTGIQPGWASEVLPLVLSGLWKRVERVTVREILDYATYPSRVTIFDLMGFGLPPERPSMIQLRDRCREDLRRVAADGRRRARRSARGNTWPLRAGARAGDIRHRLRHDREGHSRGDALRADRGWSADGRR